MTISSLLIRSFDSAVLFYVMSGCVIELPRIALREWEKSLADAAVHACSARGGTALVGADRVVSCAPIAPSNERLP
jgi:hypothetical protein